MSKFERISQPGRIGGLTVKNRVSMSPMERNWGDRIGNPTQAYIDYLVERAKADVGLMAVEATYIDPRGRGNVFQLGLWHDSNVESHRKLNDAVHQYGVLTQAEINHGGRNSAAVKTGLQPVAPSPIPNDIVGGQIPHELSREEIAEIVSRFVAGARRAVEAGYDMITIHGAHGYLVTNFLSPKFNRRMDEYGGSEENRWRFPRRVFQSIRQELGGDVPVGIRISASEDVEGGISVENSISFINHLSELGLDYVDVSAGIYESLETVIQPMDLETGCLLPYARTLKQNVSIPVIAAGRINDMEIAERALAEGDADFLHMGRAFHADPEIYSKSISGREGEVVGCIGCNHCCAVLFVNERSVCTVNPAAGRERSMKISPAESSRKVMVVGGGLAGMEAAAVAAARGHDVTLYEKNRSCGGIVTILGASKFKANWNRAAEDRVGMLRNSGANIITGKEVVPADIESEKPDVVVFATGTRPFMPIYVPGIENEIVTNYEELIRGAAKPGNRVVLIGGGLLIGAVAAEYLVESGADVTMVEPSGELAVDEEFMARTMLLERIERNERIAVRLNSNVERIGEDWVDVQSGDCVERINGIDQIVFAIQRDMERSLIEEMTGDRAADLGIETHVIGDAVFPRHPYNAVFEGAMIGRSV